MDQGSAVAQLALLLWVPTSLALFLILRPAPAAAISLLGANLLLPKGFAFDFAGVPPLGAERIAGLSALLGCLLFHPDALRGKRPGHGIEALVLILALGAIFTGLTNRDVIARGAQGSLPAMSTYDSVSLAVSHVVTFGIPFFLGRALVRRWEQIPALLIILAGAGLIYSLPILWEIRMSPRLHAIVYGYSQHGFVQTMRFGGWRPMVFTPHGLALSLFVLSAGLAGVGLWRGRLATLRTPAALTAFYLTIILVLCKSMASIAYGVIVLPVAAFARPRNQLRVAALLGTLVFLYPLARATDVFPREPLLQLAGLVSEERAASLRHRLDNEEKLVEKARERISFGWGTWGRNRIYDPITGRDLSTTDGMWIIQLSLNGIVGFLCVFGLLLAPVMFACHRLARTELSRAQSPVGVLALIVAVSVLDLIPNAFLSSFTLFLSGALIGVVPGLVSTKSKHAAAVREKPTPVRSEHAGTKMQSLRSPDCSQVGRWCWNHGVWWRSEKGCFRIETRAVAGSGRCA
jgi:hypothetical protein